MESEYKKYLKIVSVEPFSDLRALYDRGKIMRIIHGDTNKREKSRVKYFLFFFSMAF